MPTGLLQRLNSRDILRSRRQAKEQADDQLTSEFDARTRWSAPPLEPKVLEPLRLSKGATATKRLQRIRWLEIDGFVQRDNTVFYVINVYFHHAQSRLPTNHTQMAMEPIDPLTVPDLQVERRFSEFDKIQRLMWHLVQRPHAHYCTYCDAFIYKMLFTCAKPSLMTKAIVRRPKTRTKLLNKFLLNMLCEFRSNRQPCPYACEAHDAIPDLFLEFISGVQSVADIPRESV